MSILPIDDTTLRYGSKDGGRNVHADDPKLNELMERAADILNIKGHDVNGKVLYSAGDIEGHLGADGKFYLLVRRSHFANKLLVFTVLPGLCAHFPT